MIRPRLNFLVADDVGCADLGRDGGRDASIDPPSPLLDARAACGIRFTQGCANSPVCSPTRFASMTGRHPYRLRGATEEPVAARARSDATLGLPAQHPTLPSLLRGAGYRTALIRAWQLGFAPTSAFAVGLCRRHNLRRGDAERWPACVARR